jgi:hypothetical protein
LPESYGPELKNHNNMLEKEQIRKNNKKIASQNFGYFDYLHSNPLTPNQLSPLQHVLSARLTSITL